MSVITNESLSRGYFSLYAPIKYACGFIVYTKESELEWLAQCGKCPKVPGSIPGGLMYFWISLVCMAIFACYCAERVRRARSRLGARLLPVFARYQRVWPRFCHSIFHFSA